MRILVTGGAGYIGSVAVEQLVDAGHAVTVFDNLSQGHQEAVHPKAAFVEGDLANRAAVDSVLEQCRPDAVMHFASRTLVGESMERPFLYLGDNVRNGLNLLESMVDHGVRRFILSSTANLFDDRAINMRASPRIGQHEDRTALGSRAHDEMLVANIVPPMPEPVAIRPPFNPPA